MRAGESFLDILLMALASDGDGMKWTVKDGREEGENWEDGVSGGSV